MTITEMLQKMKAQPEVTKAEALGAALQICEAADQGSPIARLSLAQIVGFASTCDEPEFTRRFIVLQHWEGPVTVT